MTQKKKTMTTSPFKILDEIKFKEIKELAEKVFCESVYFNKPEKCFHAAEPKYCWRKALDFCEFADQKEKEMLG